MKEQLQIVTNLEEWSPCLTALWPQYDQEMSSAGFDVSSRTRVIPMTSCRAGHFRLIL